MRYLVISQKDRRVEEIMYDHNTENMHVKIKEERQFNKGSECVFKVKPIMYRRKELQLLTQFKIIGTIIILAYLIPRGLAFKYGAVLFVYLCFVYFPMLIVFLFVAFFQIFFLMRKKHRYEFEKSRT